MPCRYGGGGLVTMVGVASSLLRGGGLVTMVEAALSLLSGGGLVTMVEVASSLPCGGESCDSSLCLLCPAQWEGHTSLLRAMGVRGPHRVPLVLACRS